MGLYSSNLELLVKVYGYMMKLSQPIQFQYNLRTKPIMSANSPFSRYYRDIFDQKGSGPQVQSAPRGITQLSRTQSDDHHQEINIFGAFLEKEGVVEYPKAQKKIKVFGLGDRKNKKEELKSDFLKKGNEEFQKNGQISQNLLQSLQSLPDEYYLKQEEQAYEKRGDPNQLQKLLQISNETPLENNPSVNQLSQTNQEGSPLKLTESQDIEFTIPKESSRIELLLNKAPLIENVLQENQEKEFFGRTQSCQIPPRTVQQFPSNKSNRSGEGKSMNSSKIRSIFDHCSELFSHNFQVPESYEKNENPITNQMQQSQIISGRDSRDSKANSETPQSPHLQIQQCNKAFKRSMVSGNELTCSKSPKTPTSPKPPRVDIPIIKKNPKPPIIQTKKIVDKRPNVFIQEWDEKKNRKGVELKKYLSLDSHYSYQIDKLINRFEKVSELQEKKRGIKEELQKLVPKRSETNTKRYDKHYYLPIHKFPSQEQNIDYFYEGTPTQQKSILFASAPPTKRSQLVKQEYFDKTSPPDEHQNDLQKQLSKNVQNMQRIIKKFKILSKEISNQSQDCIHSHFLSESASNGFKKQGKLQNKPNKSESDHNSEMDNTDSQEDLNRYFFSGSEQPKGIKQVSSKFQVRNAGIESMRDSIQEISLSKELARVTQRTNPNFYSPRVPNQGKQTSRTEKKGLINARQTPNADARQQNHHCDDHHRYLAEQLSKINLKIEKLEKQEKNQLKQVKSEQNMKNKIIVPNREFQIKVDQQSIESDDNEDEDQSIPALEMVSYEDLCLKREKKSPRPSLERQKKNSQSPQPHHKILVRGILKERRGLGIDEKIIKKMELKFPIFDKYPSRQESLASLVSIGQYTMSILLKFLKNRVEIDLRKVKVEDNVRVKKFIDFIDYSIPRFEYRLIYYFSGKIFFGHWSQQLTNGQGYKHGFGYYLKPKKYVYEGEFHLNKKHGKGLLNTFKGEVYEGDWKKGKKDGYGVLINPTGDIYQGFFQSGKKCGSGEEQLANGDYYRGNFKKGKLNGSGVYVWADGSIYKGEFKNGLLNGRGIWRSRQNDCYEGEYKDNKKHGKGIYTWSNGQSFTGQFYQDQNIIQQPTFNSSKQKECRTSSKKRNSKDVPQRKSKDHKK